jgi:hypothetical protein
MLLLLSNIILVFGQGAKFAWADWELVKDKDKVKIYARDIKGFAGKEFKGICIIDQSIEIVGAVLFDSDIYKTNPYRWGCRRLFFQYRF